MEQKNQKEMRVTVQSNNISETLEKYSPEEFDFEVVQQVESPSKIVR